MDTITTTELQNIVSYSGLVGKYNIDINRTSAYEILSKKIIDSNETNMISIDPKAQKKSLLTQFVTSSAGRQLGRSIVREGSKILFGMIFGKK
jgi:hypothetical protein